MNVVSCNHGSTWVSTVYVDAIYRYRWWFFQINPRLLPPAWRKGNKKLIIVNGKKRGYAEVREGLIPLSRFDLPGHGLSRFILTIVRKMFGFGCREYERGYIYAKIVGFDFVIIRNVTEKGLHVCEVYDIATEKQIGTFIFNQDFTEVYPHCGYEGYENTMHIIIGYVADSLVYTLAAAHLSREIKIVV